MKLDDATGGGDAGEDSTSDSPTETIGPANSFGGVIGGSVLSGENTGTTTVDEQVEQGKETVEMNNLDTVNPDAYLINEQDWQNAEQFWNQNTPNVPGDQNGDGIPDDPVPGWAEWMYNHQEETLAAAAVFAFLFLAKPYAEAGSAALN